MIVIEQIESRVLKGNALDDPSKRDLWIYLPPGFKKTRRLPALLALAGFTGSGPSLFNYDPLGEGLEARLDRLIKSGLCKPVIVVAPDCFTKLGGNQYLNSTATGRYEDFLVKEVVPFVTKKFGARRWGVFGKSSGGYGSMILGMRNPRVFQALADHSGDSNFELCYLPDFADALSEFRAAGGPTRWLKAFWLDENRHRKKYHRPLNALAMSAHYSPNPRSPHLGIDFPFDLGTGMFRPEVWRRWQAWDPVRMAARYAAGLKKLKLVYIDCGRKDEFGLHWGARALVAELRKRGVAPHYEEFDDGHMSIAYRYDRSLPMLAAALSA